MNVLSKGLVVLALTAVAGCAQNRPLTRDPSQSDLDRMAAEYNANIENPEDHVVCMRVAEVGTRFKEVKCRTRRQIEEDEKIARRYANKPRPTVTK
jgi:hypothetical protein